MTESTYYSQEEILQTVWGEADVSESSLTRCIHSLRHHLGKDLSDRPYIKTVYGQGYCLNLPVRRVAADVRLRQWVKRSALISAVFPKQQL